MGFHLVFFLVCKQDKALLIVIKLKTETTVKFLEKWMTNDKKLPCTYQKIDMRAFWPSMKNEGIFF